jgi:5-methylcytosine-specific restriction protein B
LLHTLNDRIEALFGRDYWLGQAFFAQVQNFADLQQVMHHQIIPLLQEYFFDDWQKIRLVLNDPRKPAELQFIQIDSRQQRCIALFGEQADVALQPSYRLNTAALAQLAAYQAIC